MDPLEAVLLQIDHVAPEPWYPRAFAAARQADLGQIYLILELLHLEGLIVAGPPHPDYGPAVVLTPAGAALLRDETKLQRLRQGKPLIPGDRGGEVRSVLRVMPRGPWTQVIFLLNVAVFLYACFLAWPIPGLLQVYALSLPGQGIPVKLVDDLMNLVRDVGGVSPQDIIDGQYWRLLTCCFAHLGLLHVAMNMFALRGVGRQTEQMYGPWRYVLIYLIAGWGGSCFGLAFETMPLVGASGALCGVLAAEGAWFFVNRRYLPRSAFSRFASGFVLTVVLMVMISLIPGISGWGHLGGALFGLGAGLLLHVHRYGQTALRGPALVATLLLPLAGYGILQYGMATQPGWHAIEVERFQEAGGELQQITREIRPLSSEYQEALRNQLERRPERRDAEKVAEALQDLTRMREKVQTLQKKLDPTRYHDPDVVMFITATQRLSTAWVALLDETSRCLRDGIDWKGDNEETLREKDEAHREWRDLLQ